MFFRGIRLLPPRAGMMASLMEVILYSNAFRSSITISLCDAPQDLIDVIDPCGHVEELPTHQLCELMEGFL